MNATDAAWPLVAKDRCEANYVLVPGIAEFWNALSGILIAASGLFSLCTSKYSDEVLDLVSAIVVVNGVSATLSHATLLRFFGQIDALTITLGLLLYTKVSVLAHYPQLNTSPSGRAALNLLVMTAIFVAIGWNPANVPASLANQFDIPLIGFLPVSCVIAFISMLILAYGRNTWHMGLAKRTLIRGVLVCLVGVACWVVEEAGLMPCPSMFTLHPVWHITMAYALVAWSAFLKYHRGMFYGFKVEIKGYWWCPYTVWTEPEEGALADSHPVVNHSRGLRSGSIDKKTGRRKDGRRNTYLAPKLQRPNLGISRFSAIAQVWRGHSFYRAEARRIGSIFVPSLGARRTSQQPDVESPRVPRVLGQKQRPGWAVV